MEVGLVLVWAQETKLRTPDPDSVLRRKKEEVRRVNHGRKSRGRSHFPIHQLFLFPMHIVSRKRDRISPDPERAH